MSITEYRGETREERRMAAEAVVAKYPDLSADELNVLKRWFDKDASAHDVALMSMNRDIQPQYAAFRKDHYDRITLRDTLFLVVFWAGIFGAFAVVGLLSM